MKEKERHCFQKCVYSIKRSESGLKSDVEWFMGIAKLPKDEFFGTAHVDFILDLNGDKIPEPHDFILVNDVAYAAIMFEFDKK